jgi:N-acetylmuramoyl-L-alanine amidase
MMPDRKAMHEQKVKLYLDKENSLSGYYSIDEQGVSIYSSPADKLKNQIEFRLLWSELPQFKTLVREAPAQELLRIMTEKKDKGFDADAIAKYIKPGLRSEFAATPEKPLHGLRVAIDPGHVAGDMEMGRIEKKYLDMKPDSMGRLPQRVQIVEGQLTLQTALLLKHSLEQAGAQVMLTRSKPNETAFGKTFAEWMSNDLRSAVDSLHTIGKITATEKKSLLGKASPRDVFRKVFFELELQERARKINAFKPDLTVIIHYNVDETNTDWKHPTQKNFNMAFVPGSFMKNELSAPLARLEFLRLLVTDDIERSVQLSGMSVQAFEQYLKVPAAGPRDAKYLWEACMVTPSKGVYARNLTLTRLVHGPLVYGETLYQDNIKECLALQKENMNSNGITTCERVKVVADAYFEAVLKYAAKQH